MEDQITVGKTVDQFDMYLGKCPTFPSVVKLFAQRSHSK